VLLLETHCVNELDAMSFAVPQTLPADLALHHIGLVLPNHEAATRYREKLNLPVLAEDSVEIFSCDCIFIGREWPCVELIVPRGGQLAKFNEGRGGLHHICYKTKSVRALMDSFENGKGRWLYPAPVKGGFGLWANFLAPMHLGILTEFVGDQVEH
jgi:hypothetical protein